MTPGMIFGQALGIIATVLSFLSYQVNTKRGVLAVQTAATACTCLGYCFLGASAGFALNIVCIARNLAFYFARGKVAFYSSLGFAAIMCVLGALSWQGYASLLIIVALAVNTVFLSLGKPQLLRYSILFTSTAILIYNVFVFSIGGIVNEAVSVVSAFIGILRFMKAEPASDGSMAETP